MPIYEYVCKSCKNKFELMRPFSKSEEPADCPRCQKKAERIISTCYAKSANPYGTDVQLGGSGGGSSCSSCSSGNCSSCGG